MTAASRFMARGSVQGGTAVKTVLTILTPARAARGTLPAFRPAVSAGERAWRSHGNWHREVVQRREGLRVHHAGRGLERPVRPPLEHPGRRLSLARRGRARRVRL